VTCVCVRHGSVLNRSRKCVVDWKVRGCEPVTLIMGFSYLVTDFLYYLLLLQCPRIGIPMQNSIISLVLSCCHSAARAVSNARGAAQSRKIMKSRFSGMHNCIFSDCLHPLTQS
jgi:hypothetical protein